MNCPYCDHGMKMCDATFERGLFLICMREKGHRGSHVACAGKDFHNEFRWINLGIYGDPKYDNVKRK